MKIKYKIHTSRQTVLLAACDAELIGKTLKGEGTDFFVNPRFYEDKETDEEGIKKIMVVCSAGNLLGKDTIKAAIDIGIVEEKSVFYLGKIPHSQYILMSI